MTYTAAPASLPYQPWPETASAVYGSPVTKDFPTPRSVMAEVTGGLDGLLRVAMLLRGRRYQVRDLTIAVREGATTSRVGCTVILTASEADLLLRQLRRLPTVVSAGAFDPQP